MIFLRDSPKWQKIFAFRQKKLANDKNMWYNGRVARQCGQRLLRINTKFRLLPIILRAMPKNSAQCGGRLLRLESEMRLRIILAEFLFLARSKRKAVNQNGKIQRTSTNNQNDEQRRPRRVFDE
jgi:hypothetical protein